MRLERLLFRATIFFDKSFHCAAYRSSIASTQPMRVTGTKSVTINPLSAYIAGSLSKAIIAPLLCSTGYTLIPR